MVYGNDPSSLLPFVPGATRISDLEDFFEERDAILHLIKDNLASAQIHMKTRANSHCRIVTFAVGDMVFLKVAIQIEIPFSAQASQVVS